MVAWCFKVLVSCTCYALEFLFTQCDEWAEFDSDFADLLL